MFILPFSRCEQYTEINMCICLNRFLVDANRIGDGAGQGAWLLSVGEDAQADLSIASLHMRKCIVSVGKAQMICDHTF